IIMALGQDVPLSAVQLAVVPVLGISVSLIVKNRYWTAPRNRCSEADRRAGDGRWPPRLGIRTDFP
ncbi:hypothetical protein, partial [Streptomyces microflavus]|uniref:hypothetical protein n=1 Tax=Streptomyces microflavus TaxID=1919 RepID=UPI0033B40CBD